jgi:hypothetical protein
VSRTATIVGTVVVSALALAGLAVALRPRRPHRGPSSTAPLAGPSPAPAAAVHAATAPAPPSTPGSGFPGLAPALAALRAEVDAAWPKRSRASDGGAPSEAHHAANPNSDHERGDAFDFTVDRAHGPDPDGLAELARADDRVQYVIWNERKANKDIDGNAWRTYERTAIQTDPHTSHIHISVKHAARDNVRPWGAASVGQERIA